MYTAILGIGTAVIACLGVIFNVAAMANAGGMVVIAIVIGLTLDTAAKAKKDASPR